MAKKDEVQKVWEKGKTIRGKNPETHRKDNYGNEIYRHSYGKTSEKGWEIDHKKPLNKNGTDTMRNKQPLQSSENRKKSDNYPYKKKK